ncbi:protein translocase subunit SecD [Gleimia europaea]|uniref:protein translocase subunit SecD n=1 Tax=Gleimia europaea TaxID=66228 RepID=UPI002658AF1C|nr:protein translocase subunit SecD [Gleimia europaea]MDK7143774.1 protein translocase subunit SecD [Gleimia europaea]
MAKKASRPGRKLMSLGILIIIALITLGIGSARGSASMVPGLALDLQGGTQLILTPTPQEGEDVKDVTVAQEDLDQAIEIIRKRIDASGVAEAEITSQAGRNIVVALPGEPSEETLNLVRSSAVMRFRPVLAAGDPAVVDPEKYKNAQSGKGTDQNVTDPSAQPSETEPAEEQAEPTAAEGPDLSQLTPQELANTLADTNKDGEISDKPVAEPKDNSDPNWVTEQVLHTFFTTDCKAPEQRAKGSVDDPAQPLVACDVEGNEKYILGPVDLEGIHLTSATAGMNRNEQGQSTGKWIVSLQFDKEGTDIFADVSKRLVDLQSVDPTRNRFAVVLDGNVISAPRMNSVIPNGSALIEGNFTADSARALANQLQFGSLPLNFTVESEQRISATLGADHLRTGLLTGIIGLVLVLLYLIWQYRGLSILAGGSLIAAGVIVYTLITLLSWLMGYRLSLAGVAGLIVSVGITADSFIVYFERIRDEVRSGRPLVSAVSEGWDRAKRTIIVSDFVNLLAAAVLYFLAVGGVQGFAFTLGLTTLVDLAIILWFTHPLMELLVRTEFFGGGHKLSGLDPEHLGAKSAAIYAGRGRFREPKRNEKHAKTADQPGRKSIAQQRREAEETAKMEAEAAVVDTAEDASTEEEGK